MAGSSSLPPGLRALTALRTGWTAVARRLRLLRPTLPARIPIAIKLSVVIAATIVVVMSLLGSLILENQTRLLKSQVSGFGHSMAEQLAESAKEPLLAEDRFALEILVTNLGRAENILGVAIVSAKGGLAAHTGLTPFDEGAPREGGLQPYLGDARHALEWDGTGTDGGPVIATTFIRPIRFQDVIAGHTVITIDRQPMERSLRDALRAIAAATAVIIVLGIVLSVAIGRHMTGPIAPLVDATNAIGRGQYHVRIRERRNDEIGNLIDSFNQMADGLLQKAQVESAFSRYVSSTVAKEVLANLDEVHLGGKRVQASVLFADIVGFTTMAETLNPEQVAELLNEYFGHISRACETYTGIVDKYIGDCAMLVFGVPEEDSEHAFHAIACAVLINRVVARLNGRRASAGMQPLHFRLGLSSGSMLAGNMGSQDRMQYTVVGDTVNLASRLCSYAGPGQIVVCKEMLDLPNVEKRVVWREHRFIQLRGKAHAVETFIVDDLAPRYHALLEEQVDAVIGAPRILAAV